MKIVVCGGHLTPALAIIDYLLTTHKEDEIVFVGRQYSQDVTKQLSNEAREIEQRHLTFVPFSAPRINQALSLAHLLLLPKLVWSIFRGINLLYRQKPHVFVSFGGYLALPLAIACYILGIPVVTHEQTRAVGFSNQLIARLAKKVAISHPTSAKYFPQYKTILTGNPLRPGLFATQPTPEWYSKATAKPLLYITGGNQGSEILNIVTQQALRQLVGQWFVVHQCGNPTLRRNYKLELEQARKQLPSTQRNQYVIKEWISETELGWIYQHATMVISRAGANTVSELTAHHLPAILIPLPFAHHDEQHLNAQHMKELGGAEIIAQKDLTAPLLIKAVQTVKKYHKTMQQNLAATPTDLSATEKLYQVIKTAAR